MTERWVPTGREFDEGAQSPLAPGKAQRRSRLLDRVLGRKRRARREIEVRPGVGEARMVVQTPPPLPKQELGPEDPPSLPGEPPPFAPPVPAAAQAAPPAVEPPGRRRRQTTVRPGVVPEIGPRAGTTDGGRVGSWPEHLTDSEMRRSIGPTQDYDDAT